jgi:flagellar hook-basal body complex protein FliE
MNDLTISKLQSILPKTVEPKQQTLDTASASPFSDYVKQSLNEVNHRMLEADQAIDDLVTGKNQDIHRTMISMQKAEVSFELVMQIRNKVIAAYDEIRKMAI